VARPGRAAEHRPHPGHKLVVDERPHDIVVASAREAPHAVDGVAARADHDHGHVAVPRAPGLPLAEAAADLEPRSVWEHRVEEDEARPHLFDEIERGRAAIRRKHLEPVVGELLLEVGPHGSLVLDDQDRPPHHGRRRYRSRRGAPRCPFSRNGNKPSPGVWRA